MKITRGSVVVVVLLVLLAGCSAGPTGPDTDGDSTPTTLEPPSGANESAIVDQTQIVGAHTGVLANQSYAITAIQRVGDQEQRVEIRSNRTQMRAHANATGGGQLAGTELFITDSAAYVKRGSGDQTQYSVQDSEVSFAEQHRRQMGSGYVIAVLEAGQFEAVGQTTVNGVPVWEYELVEYEGTEVLPANGTGATGTVQIDGEGIVRTANVSVRTSDSETGVTIRISYRVDDVGSVVVPEPPWLETARSESNTSA